jgi:hypothetical protein
MATKERPKVKAGFMKDRVKILGDIMEPFDDAWVTDDKWL